MVSRSAARGAGGGNGGGELLVWDLDKGGAPLRRLEGHTSLVLAIACHGEGDARRAVSGDSRGTLLVWDLVKGGAPLLKLEGAGWVNTVACHGEGDDWCIVSGSRDDGTVRLWDGAAGAVYPLGSGVKSVALAPRAGEVDVFASVGKSFAHLALRAGPSQLAERVKEERPHVEEENARRKAAEEEEQARRAKRPRHQRDARAGRAGRGLQR